MLVTPDPVMQSSVVSMANLNKKRYYCIFPNISGRLLDFRIYLVVFSSGNIYIYSLKRCDAIGLREFCLMAKNHYLNYLSSVRLFGIHLCQLHRKCSYQSINLVRKFRIQNHTYNQWGNWSTQVMWPPYWSGGCLFCVKPLIRSSNAFGKYPK